MKALLILILFHGSLLVTACAQTDSADKLKITLSSPLNYQVFQRQTKAVGTIIIAGQLEVQGHTALTNLDRLEACLIGNTVTNAWAPLPFDNRVRRFRGELTAPAGGWYRLEIRLIGHGLVAWTATVEHVGVGELFLVAGQSNSANHGEEKQSAKSPLVVAYSILDGHWQPARDPEPGASGKGGSFLPAFGDAMTAHFQVPVGLVALGVGSTSVREWLPAGDAMAAPPTTGMNTITTGSNQWVCTGALFDKIVAAEKTFGPHGFRALLWHQGESDSRQPPDREITPAQYRMYLQRVIESSRTAAGWRVPWFVAQASYHTPEDQSTPELCAAQKSLVTDGLALAGPATDQLGPEFRQNNGRGIHFNARGLQRHGQLWAEAVTPWLEQQSADK